MNNTAKWTISQRIPYEAPDDYRKHILEELQRRVGFEMFAIVWSQKLPCVIDINEKTSDIHVDSIYLGECSLIEYEISVTPVEHKHVTMFHTELPTDVAVKKNIFVIIKRKIKELFK